MNILNRRLWRHLVWFYWSCSSCIASFWAGDGYEVHSATRLSVILVITIPPQLQSITMILTHPPPFLANHSFSQVTLQSGNLFWIASISSFSVKEIGGRSSTVISTLYDVLPVEATFTRSSWNWLMKLSKCPCFHSAGTFCRYAREYILLLIVSMQITSPYREHSIFQECRQKLIGV